MRHEVDGESIDALAAATHVSARAIATRLSRARAILRVELVLAYRRTQLPTEACRPNLLALSSGDRRRQHQLDTSRHLHRCPTCAELAEPITQHRRSIAAWLLVPIADAVGRIIRSFRDNHWTQAATAAVLAAGAITAFAISRPDHPPAPA
jgi:serine/threonine-protein kinase RsbT